MSKTITIKRDELTLEGLLDGPENAPLVIVVHGFPDTPISWDAVVPGLIEAGFRVLRPWLRGYTEGSAHRDARYDLIAVSDDLVAWREHLVGPTGQAHLIGHDWGSVASITAVAGNPQGWKTVSLLAIPPLQSIRNGGWLLPVQAWQSSYMLVLQSDISPWLIRQYDFAYLHYLWRWWSPGWNFNKDDFAPVSRIFSNPDIAWAATRYYRSLFTIHRAATREFISRIHRPIAVPTLALAGERDGCFHAGLLQRIIDPKLFPTGIRAATLADCGHFLHAERPQAVLEELLVHLKGSTAQG